MLDYLALRESILIVALFGFLTQASDCLNGKPTPVTHEHVALSIFAKLMYPSPCPLPAPVKAKPVHSAGRGIKGEGWCALFVKKLMQRSITFSCVV